MTQSVHLPLKVSPKHNKNPMEINDSWWKSMIFGQFWGHFWAKVHKIINHWNERCTVVVWVLYATWIISECSGPSNMVIPSSWHLISCRTAQIPLGARHPSRRTNPILEISIASPPFVWPRNVPSLRHRIPWARLQIRERSERPRVRWARPIRVEGLAPDRASKG